MQNQDQLILNVQHLEKRFGENLVLRDIDFQVRPGQVTSIIGSSGSGKSTLLRCLNLLEEPTGGDILYHGQSILNGKKMNINKYRTQVGMVFQSFNLFKNFTAL
ncbi:ATP-binding cassette domain-containing protein, partial [Aerococcus sp. L_32]